MVAILSTEPGKAEHIRLVKMLAALFTLLVLLAYSESDPTPLNPFWPAEGITNLFGLPGALYAGTIIVLFGRFAYFIPIYLFLFKRKGEVPLATSFLYAFFLFGGTGTLLALALPFGDDGVVFYFGLWGYAARSLLADFSATYFAILGLSIFIFQLSRHITVDFILKDYMLVLFAGARSTLALIFKKTSFGKIKQLFNKYLVLKLFAFIPFIKKYVLNGDHSTEARQRRSKSSISRNRLFDKALEEYAKSHETDSSKEIEGIGYLDDSTPADRNLDKIFNDILDEEEKEGR